MRKIFFILVIVFLFANATNAGMLTGQTPSTLVVPNGWSIVRTQDFEGTRQDSSEYWNGIPVGGTASTTNPHSGSRSLRGAYNADSDAMQWALEDGYSGAFSEIYLSFWEYTDSNARFNDEYLLAHIKDPNNVDDLVFDFMWSPEFNSTQAYFRVVAEGLANDTPGHSPWDKGFVTVPVGAWNQWEIHIRPGTPGQPDGFFKIYLNGEPYMERINTLILGEGRTFENGRILAGGFYTKIVWMKDYPTCSIPSGCLTWEERAAFTGSDLCVEQEGWWGQSFASPLCAPNDPPLPSFYRQIDDVIVLKTSGESAGDTTPPYTNNNLPGKNSTGWPVGSHTVQFYVRDPSGVVRSSIGLSIDGGAVMRCDVELVCSP